MQKTATKVASITVQHTVDDLMKKREKIREINILPGHKDIFWDQIQIQLSQIKYKYKYTAFLDFNSNTNL